VRQVLGFAVRRIFESEAAAAGAVRRLRSRSPGEAEVAAREIAQRLAGLVAG
jgi:hypothetical protein